MWAQSTQTSGTTGDCTWSYDSNTKTLTISGYGATDTYYDDNPLENRPWHSLCSEIQKVIVCEGVTRLGAQLFRNCSSLTEVTLPSSLAAIENHCFFGCSNLTSITLPNYLQKIGMYCFEATGLTSIHIPASVTTIDDAPFYNSANLTSVTVDAANPNYASIDAILIAKNNLGEPVEILNYPMAKADTHYEVPTTVKRIGRDAFFGQKYLEQLTIHEGVTWLGDRMCRGVTNLSKVILLGNTPPEMEIYFTKSADNPVPQTFLGCSNDIKFYVPSDKKSAYTATNWSFYESRIEEYNTSDIQPKKASGSLIVHLNEYTHPYSGGSVTPTLSEVLCEQTADITSGGSLISDNNPYTPIKLNSTDYDASIPSGSANVGQSTVSVTGKGTYSGATGRIGFTIVKVPVTVKAKDHSITYGDVPTNNGIEYSGFVNGETENTVSITNGVTHYTYNYTQYGDVGSNYKITPVIPANMSSTNYYFTAASDPTGTLTVNQKEVDVNWSNTSLTYNGNEQAPTATATGTVNSDEIAVTVTGGQVNVGTGITATASGLTGTKAANYKLPDPAPTTTYDIGKKDVIVSGITVSNKEYDGTTAAIVNTSNATFAGKVAADELTVTASGNTFSDKNVGDRTVALGTLTLGGVSADNYQLAASGQQTEASAQITAKALTITADNKSRDYGAANPEFTATYDGFVTGESETDESVVTTKPVLTTTASKTSSTGTYDITFSTDAVAPNYSITHTKGTLTVGQADLSGVEIETIDNQVIATGASAEPSVTVTYNGITVPASDYTVSYSNNTTAGTGTVTLTSKNGNFTESTTKSADFNILRALGISFDGSNRKWATYYAAENLTLPTGMTAYIVTDVSSDAVTLSEPLNYIPANVGVLLSYETTGSDFKSAAWAGSTENYSASLLAGSVSGTTVPEGGYILYNNEFVRSTGTATLAANRCYLTVPSSGARQSFAIGDGTTAIDSASVFSDLMSDGDWYSIDGRKFTQMPTKKGLYIKNGKKVVIK